MVSRGSSYKSAVNDNSRKTSATLVPITPDFASRKSRALSAPYLSPPLSPIYDKRRNNSSDTGKLFCFSTEMMNSNSYLHNLVKDIYFFNNYQIKLIVEEQQFSR